jgi:hypothetical protein
LWALCVRKMLKNRSYNPSGSILGGKKLATFGFLRDFCLFLQFSVIFSLNEASAERVGVPHFWVIPP